MTKTLKHKFNSAVADGADATLVRPSNWNDDHNFYWGVRSVTITSDTIVDADNFTLVTYNNAGAVGTNFPAPTGGLMAPGWMTKFKNLGAGIVTVTGTGGATFGNLGGSFTLNQYDSIEIFAPTSGTAYNVVQDLAPISAAMVSSFGIDNLSIAASVASNILTVSLVGANGAALSATNQGRISFRSATAGSGNQIIDTLTSPVSVATAVGASLGAAANKAFRLWVVAFENSGAVVLGLFNAMTPRSTNSCQVATINEALLQTSFAIGSGSTAAGTFYASSALTNRPVRILGFIEWSSTGLTTPGTYTRVSDFIVGVGPGVKLPGDIISEVHAEPTSSFSTTSAALVYTGVSASLSMSSAANLAEVEIQGTVGTWTANQTAYLYLSRGTANGVNLVGNYTWFGIGAGTGVSPFHVKALDPPNVLGIVYYGLQLASDSGAVGAALATGTIFSTQIREIMG